MPLTAYAAATGLRVFPIPSADTVLLHTGQCHSSTGGSLPSRWTPWNRARSCLHLCLGAIALLLISLTPSLAGRPRAVFCPAPRPSTSGRSHRYQPLRIRLGPLLRATGRGLGRWVGGPSARYLRAPAEEAALTTAGWLRTNIRLTLRAQAHRPPPATGPEAHVSRPRAARKPTHRWPQAALPAPLLAMRRRRARYPVTASPATWRARRTPERFTIVSAKTRAASPA